MRHLKGRLASRLAILCASLATAWGCGSDATDSPDAAPAADGGTDAAVVSQDAGGDTTESAPTFSVGGTVTGLTAAGLVLADNGGDPLTVAKGSATFTFATALPNGAPYAVTVQTQPTGLTCAVTSGSGAIAGANVTAMVACITPAINEWTWTNGAKVTGAAATYGSLGTADPLNTPGARYASSTWADATNLWLFGGTPSGGTPKQNDLWKFDGTSWTWMKGKSTTNASGVYGTPGTADPLNTPGARYFASSWKDRSGKFWLFGGRGYDSAGTEGMLSDLWEFDGTSWTWMSGSSTADTAAVYGTLGTAGPLNTPGGRHRALSWIDVANNAWIFGGLDGAGNELNDLWKFNGTSWTWISGSKVANASGIYGTLGTPDVLNAPGARQDSISWIDSTGYLWLFGGWGYDSAGLLSDLGDLWRFDGTRWTWITGSKVGDPAASYGTLGTTAPSNDPGARENAISWSDAHGNQWLMGGTSSHDVVELNDLWKFDGTHWTWVSGGKTTDPFGNYGPLGTAGTTYIPGGRDSAAAWTDAAGNLWLYGGWGLGTSGSASDLSDLWRYQP